MKLVISNDDGIGAPGILALEEALRRGVELAADLGVDQVMCIGGGQLYAQAIGNADRLEITEVDAQPSGDTRFPDIDPAVWQEVGREPGQRTERDSADFTFVTYRRKA